jgi:nucleoid-associated protein YgaU
VVPRKPKLIAAAAVLAVGLGLAWPWRRGEIVPAAVLPVSTSSTSFGSVPPPHSTPTTGSAASSPVSATTIGLRTSTPLVERTPISSAPQADAVAKPLVAESNRSAPLATESSTHSERTYVIQKGDSLERLALRYLGDEARAIEIFDLNRQVLENPHILPLGTELKIPMRADVDVPTTAP